MWHYQKSESELWTVGHYGEGGKWKPESDWPTAEEAAERTSYLNGAGLSSGKLVRELEQRLEAETTARVKDFGNAEKRLRKLEGAHARALPLLEQLDCRTIDNGRQLAELGEKVLELESSMNGATGRALSLVGILEAVTESLAQIDGPAQPERRAAARVNRETWRQELGTVIRAAWGAGQGWMQPGSAEQAIASSPAAQRLAAYIERLEAAGFPPGAPMPAYPAIPGEDVTQ